MFIGRHEELDLLEELYSSKRFQFLVMYGRRRFGKTSLLQEFAKKHKTIFFECKFRNILFDIKEYNDLMTASEIFREPENRYYYLFSKSGFTDEVIKRAEAEGVKLITADELFEL